ncbi:hypothetical protein PUATCC27989T_04026 [Phytobacter ursingii]|nr:hypothetical protein PUATCC27989T_04026 [Phytobacter ursingii]
MTAQLPCRERLEKIASWREMYGAGHNVMLPAEEAESLARFALEHAAEIEQLKRQVIHVVMPMMVPPAVIQDMKARRIEHALCLKCNEGARGGCSACAYNER